MERKPIKQKEQDGIIKMNPYIILSLFFLALAFMFFITFENILMKWIFPVAYLIIGVVGLIKGARE